MKERIPLQIVGDRLILTAVVECPSLRIHKQIMEFVVDTGSPDSYLSNKDVMKLQIPVRNRSVKGIVDFGGSRFQQVELPKFNMYLLKEDIQNKSYIELKISLLALKTTKISEEKIQVAYSLPSILGLDFLKEQKLSLHVILTENIAYLQSEG